MRELLERWSKLEPSLCHQDKLDFRVGTTDSFMIMSADDLVNRHLAWIQWTVQQSIIEKGWYFLIHYNHEYYSIEMGPEQPSPRFTKGGENLAECLLATYLVELESSANP